MIDRIRAVREAVSIYDLLAEHGVSVATTSRPQKLHCPVHDDRHKSAVVYPDTQEIWCFSENRTYDVVSLVQEWEGLEWWEACAWLEERVGLVYERQSNPQDEFWRMVRVRGEGRIDPRQAYDLRWAIHRTVLELCSEVEVDWGAFDELTDVDRLLSWRDAQLERAGVDVSGLEGA